MYRHPLKMLERCLRTILDILWYNRVSGVKVLEWVDINCIEDLLLSCRLHWAGHISRMHDHWLHKIALYGELSSGRCNRDASKMRYKDSLE
ncbi:hypothetical protein Ahia01_000750500 [Argonauta hians]